MRDGDVPRALIGRVASPDRVLLSQKEFSVQTTRGPCLGNLNKVPS